jgi:uncharacterized membrane protein YkvA (DUF1232 family)
VFEAAKQWAKTIRRDVLAVWIASRDPRVPWYAQVVAGTVAAYAFSPIDLIPDFIPVLGYLDDIIIVPAGIALAVRLIPRELMIEFKAEAERRAERPINRAAALVIVLFWVLILALLVRAFLRR